LTAAGASKTLAQEREARQHEPLPGWSRGDSNPGPPPCKGGALPAKLRPPVSAVPPPGGVGAPGLEPGTSALSGPRSNHLSYAPAGRSPCLLSGGLPRVAPGPPSARCPRRSARRTPHTAHHSPPGGAADLPGIASAPARSYDRLATGGPRGSVPSAAGSAPGDLTRSGPRCRRPAGRRTTHPLPRKEVIQPQLPLRLPCYDFVPITSPALDGCLPAGNPPGWPTGFRRCRLS
jgi:hypothetical protein